MRRLALLVLALLLLTGCGGQPQPSQAPTPAVTPTPTAPPTPDPTPEPTPYDGPVNPLTGLPVDEAWADRRPVAVMINNLQQALPQLGISQADLIYEVPAEGGITRMLAVYQDPSGVGTIGSIRSARPYFLELALGHDAIFIHAGGSEDAYSRIHAWGVTALDGVRGPYLGKSPGSNLLWRDPERRKTYSLEHTVVTTGETVARFLENSTALRIAAREDLDKPLVFLPDATPAQGSPAQTIEVVFSHYKSGRFTYDPQSGKYLAEEYGQPYVDGNTGGQLAVTNVLILRTACRYTGDSLGHITVDLSSGGTGYLASGGRVTDLCWAKSYPDGALVYTDLDGNPLPLTQGTSYICIVPLSASATFS